MESEASGAPRANVERIVAWLQECRYEAPEHCDVGVWRFVKLYRSRFILVERSHRRLFVGGSLVRKRGCLFAGPRRFHANSGLKYPNRAFSVRASVYRLAVSRPPRLIFRSSGCISS
jgi:hypothetical protein